MPPSITRRDLLAAAAGAAAVTALPRGRTSGRVDIIVIRRRDERELFKPPCSADRCALVDVSGDEPPRSPTAAIGVLTGHSAPPVHVLGRRPDALMAFVAQTCQHGLVLDTCYGMSDTVLRPLVAAGYRGYVVGPLRKLPSRGLIYGPAFFDRTAPIAERLGAVQDPAGIPLVYWEANERDLDDARRQVEGLRPEDLARGLVRRHPHMYISPLGAAAHLLTHIPVERFSAEEDALTSGDRRNDSL